MNTKRMTTIIFLSITTLAVYACAPGGNFGPVSTPTLTFTLTPKPTMTPTITPTPVPVCKPGNVIQSVVNQDINGLADILQVSTTLNGTLLEVTFTVREIPDEITINKSSVRLFL